MIHTTSSNDTRSPLMGFFISQIKDIYWAENYLLKTLPKMKHGATSRELREVLERHLYQTRQHVMRLEDIFDLLGEQYESSRNEDIECLVEESEIFMDETDPGNVIRDVSLILAAQKVEHYEIASYRGLVQLARTLGLHRVREILEETLSEEKQTDKLLTAISENCLNYAATEA